MTGQYRTLDLAGVSTATSLWNPFFTFLTGIVSALTPIVGHHLGKGNNERIAGDFYQFLYMSFGMAILLIGFVWGVCTHDSQADRLRKCCCPNSHSLFIFPFSGNLTPYCSFSIVRTFLDTLGMTRLSMYLMLLLCLSMLV